MFFTGFIVYIPDYSYTIDVKDGDCIYIEVTRPNKIKDFFHKAHSRLEDMMFSIVQKMPDRFIPGFIMEWLDRYTTKRIAELKQGIIKDRWESMELDKAVDNISIKQNTKKAPTEG